MNINTDKLTNDFKCRSYMHSSGEVLFSVINNVSYHGRVRGGGSGGQEPHFCQQNQKLSTEQVYKIVF